MTKDTKLIVASNLVKRGMCGQDCLPAIRKGIAERLT
jgi:hypothetical protein